MKRESYLSYSSSAKQRVTIKYRTSTPDGEGGFIITWNNRPGIWADIFPMSARQKYEYESINVFATHYVKILGDLTYQSNTKYVNDIWTITWSGILGTDIQLHYQIDGGSWVLISASEPNSGTYDWTIPIGAIGKLIIVRVMHLTDTDSYVLTDPYNIVPEGSVDGLPNEHDEIDFTANGVTRSFEILTVENILEQNIYALITCRERRD